MNAASLVGHLLELLKLNDAHHQPADRLISTFFRDRKYLGSTDRRTLSDHFFGIIRHRRFLEALLEQYLIEHPGDGVLDHPHDRYLSLFATFHFTRKPEHEISLPQLLWKTTFPAIDLQKFTEGILKHEKLDFLGNEQNIRLGVRHSFQDWMVGEWLDEFGDKAESLLESLNVPANTALRVNTLKVSRDACQALLLKEGIATSPSAIAPDGLIAAKRFNTQASPASKDGLYEMQDEGSQVVSLLANPMPGMFVIDACAGAGGKSLHLGALVKNEGEIIAIDVDEKRLQELSRRAARSGVSIIKTQLRNQVVAGNFHSKADIVLIDAPCSGSGTIRRNPWFKWSISESIVGHYSAMQSEIISFNAPFVKVGGTLVYATCSLFTKENEEVILGFLQSHSNFTNITDEVKLPIPGIPGNSGFVKLHPHIHGTDGFTVCVLRRVT